MFLCKSKKIAKLRLLYTYFSKTTRTTSTKFGIEMIHVLLKEGTSLLWVIVAK